MVFAFCHEKLEMCANEHLPDHENRSTLHVFFQMSIGSMSDVRRSGCPNVRMSEGPDVRRSGRPKIYITDTTYWQIVIFL